MSNIKTAVSSGYGIAVLVAAMSGAIIGDILPTPGDALYFWDQQRLKKKLEAGQITSKQFWIKNAAGYYLYNSVWWAAVLGVVVLTKGDFDRKLKIGLGLVGVGAVGSIIYTNIKKDN